MVKLRICITIGCILEKKVIKNFEVLFIVNNEHKNSQGNNVRKYNVEVDVVTSIRM